MRAAVLESDDDRRHLLVAFKDRGADLEQRAWALLTKGRTGGSGEPVAVVESGVIRGPRWRLRRADGAVKHARPGDWLVRFALDRPTWAQYRAGAVTPQDLLHQVEPPRKEDVPMAKKTKTGGLAKATGEMVEAALDRFDDPYELAKARYEDEPTSRSALADLRLAGSRRLKAKLVVRDNALDGAGRLGRGLPTPLVTNRRALPADTNVIGYR